MTTTTDAIRILAEAIVFLGVFGFFIAWLTVRMVRARFVVHINCVHNDDPEGDEDEVDDELPPTDQKPSGPQVRAN